jgi:hypothetical protein
MFSEHVKAEEDMYEQYLKLENKRLKHDWSSSINNMFDNRNNFYCISI